MTLGEALSIGVVQCAALWPGMPRSMVTILAALAVGFPMAAAAEYSFLLALPTLGAATLYALLTEGTRLVRDIGWGALLCGWLSAALVGALAIRGFVRYLTRHSLALFGWYRLSLAALMGVVFIWRIR